jgi:hypothetical protein
MLRWDGKTITNNNVWEMAQFLGRGEIAKYLLFRLRI